MSDRAEFVAVLRLMERVDRALFRDASCWLGGGTAVALRCAQFRLSRDVDFLCASHEGYRTLRALAATKGIRSLFSGAVEPLREPRIDRYGIRAALAVDGVAVKFEVVSEGRVCLAGTDDASVPVARLCDEDLVAEKLLANDDRHLDDSTLGRDAIDLIVLEHTLGGLPIAAWDKARDAYGATVDRAWQRALLRLRQSPQRLDRAFEALAVTEPARSIVVARLSQVELPEE